jgi:hypothetical protein
MRRWLYGHGWALVGGVLIATLAGCKSGSGGGGGGY